MRLIHTPCLLILATMCAVTCIAEEKKAPEKKDAPRIIGKPVGVATAVASTRPAVLTNMYSLVRNVNIKEEIKLTADQETKIQEAYQKQTAQRREMALKLREVDPAERQKALDEYRKEIQAQTDELNKSIKQLLKPEQAKRLEQIAVQRQGITALAVPEIAKKLKLTDMQLQLIAAAQQAGAEKRQQLYQDLRDGKFDRTQLAEKNAEIQKETEANIMKLLTMAQQTGFSDLKGPKFDFGGPNRFAVPGAAIKLRLEARPR